MIRGLVEQRVDPVLFGWSYDYVGDMAETVALVWPPQAEGGEAGADRQPAPSPGLSEVVEQLSRAGRVEAPRLAASWPNALDAAGRWAPLKLTPGRLRRGVSARCPTP